MSSIVSDIGPFYVGVLLNIAMCVVLSVAPPTKRAELTLVGSAEAVSTGCSCSTA